MEINVPVHTVLFTIAPSEAGKTTFCKTKLLPSLKEKYSDLNIQYVSSDDIRRELLGDDSIDKNDSSMLHISNQAFNILNTKIESLMKFPLCSEIIVVDTMGLSDDFRKNLKMICDNNNYNCIPILFNYNDRNDYFKFIGENTPKKFISDGVNKLKRSVLSSIRKENYYDIIRIKDRDIDISNIEISNYSFYKSHFIYNDTKEFVVVSDLHGCLDEFKNIILKNNCTIEDDIIIGNKIFIVQDYVDKGSQILELLEFIHKNTKNGSVLPLLANHENYVYKRLKGILKEQEVDIYFDSIHLISESELHKEMFFELVENHSKNFYKNKNFFVNHAPVEYKFMGKIDSKSLQKQRNISYPKYDIELSLEDNIKNIEDFLKPYVNKEYSIQNYTIIWGHVSMANFRKFNNMVYMIDTGCVYGNKLTSVSITRDGRVFTKSTSSKSEVKKDLLNLFEHKETIVDLNRLEYDDKRRIEFLVKNKINFISGTVSPCDKNLELNILEDLANGLEYYKNKGVQKVILQPKYMGSRCNIYLNKDINKSYCSSRNGFLFDMKNLQEELEELYDNDYIKSEFNKGAEVILLDSELLPWSLIGKGLIEKSFYSVETGLETETKILKESGFEDYVNELMSDSGINEFKVDMNLMKKKDLADKYGYRKYENYKNLLPYIKLHSSISETEEQVRIYKKQISLYASDYKKEFKPFSILKVVYSGGSEKLFFDDSNIDIFSSISNDEYHVVDFNDPNYLDNAYIFYNKLTTENGMEGVVIKPEKVYTKGIVPYIKCRNKEYLSIIYGYDYTKKNKYSKLINRKNITKKMKMSIKEFEYGKKMLEVPYNEISIDNKELVSLYYDMIVDERELSKLDPRL